MSRDAVHNFVQWYKKNYPEPTLPEVSTASVPEAKSERTREELEKELAYANLKITAFEILISNAEGQMAVGSKAGTNLLNTRIKRLSNIVWHWKWFMKSVTNCLY